MGAEASGASSFQRQRSYRWFIFTGAGLAAGIAACAAGYAGSFVYAADVSSCCYGGLAGVFNGKQPAGEWDITLYQFATCPFSKKVRSFLDYNNLPYNAVEVHPLSKAELKKFTEYKKVPVIVVNSKQVNDSSAIITAIANRARHPDATDLPEITEDNKYEIVPPADADEAEYALEAKWRRWVDDVFVHLVAPNIYRTWGESLQAFAYIAEQEEFSKLQREVIRYLGALAMYLVSPRLKKRYGLKDDVRESFAEAGNEWMSALGQHDFMGGVAPNLADLALYGVLSSIDGFDAFADLDKDVPGLGAWYQRVREAVGQSCRINAE